MAYLSDKDIDKVLDRHVTKLIERLDDRYVKKDSASDSFITRLEGKVATWIFSFAVLCLTAYATWRNR